MGSQTCPKEASGTNEKNLNSIIEIVCLDNRVKIPAISPALGAAAACLIPTRTNQDLTGRGRMMPGKYLIQIPFSLIEN